MTIAQIPSPSDLFNSVEACFENGNRLLEETYDLEFREPPATRYFLIIIAQEEFAKAFILFLVKENVIALDRPVLRAINDHACKQLIGMIMDYMIMHWDEVEELEAAISADYDLGDRLPNDVGSAMELFRYEKIGRWEANNWVWAEDPEYDISALRIAEGRKDRRKQDALYIRIGKDGRVCRTPQMINEGEMREEFERAQRYKDFVGSILNGEISSRRYDKAMRALKSLFESQRRLVE